jgi:hypothetical protein
MEQREISVKASAAKSIAAIALFIEAKVMPETALRFSNAVYDFIEQLAKLKKVMPLVKNLSEKS